MKAVCLIWLGLAFLVGCTGGDTSEEPPIHLVQNMDEQPKVKQQSESRFHADGLAMRMPVEGAVARGNLREDSAFYYDGLNDDGGYVPTSPIAASAEFLTRGEDRYEVFCAPCHGTLGDAKSIMVEKEMPVPPSLHEERLRDSLDGYFYHVVSNGLGNMPPYKYQISPHDRWAIVAHLRALQKSRPVVPNSTPESRLQKQATESK